MLVEAVLPDNVCNDNVELCLFWCGVIKDSKKTSHIVKYDVILPVRLFCRELGENYPLNHDCLHLKRVMTINDELNILIKQVRDKTETAEIFLHQAITNDLGKVHQVHVPLHKPITHKQFTESQKYWKCHFHEDKKLEKYLSGNIFIQEEMKKHQQYIELVKDGSAIIVDPTTDGVLIKAHGNKTHLLQHSVMNAIDKIAYSQGGGVNSKTSLLQDPSIHDHDDVVILPQAKRSKLDSYLCTGYDLYIKMEPCIMCSMGLVHSRIGRVFYMISDPMAGGLGSKCKIHCHPKVNHHFEVFKLYYTNHHQDKN